MPALHLADRALLRGAVLLLDDAGQLAARRGSPGRSRWGRAAPCSPAPAARSPRRKAATSALERGLRGGAARRRRGSAPARSKPSSAPCAERTASAVPRCSTCGAKRRASPGKRASRAARTCVRPGGRPPPPPDAAPSSSARLTGTRKRPPEDRVQHLGLLGLHAGALARAQHHRRQRFGHRGQPHCKGAAAGVKRHHLLRGGSGDVADRQRSDTAPLNVGVARPGPGAGQRRGPAGPRARGPRRGAAERAGGGRRPRGA